MTDNIQQLDSDDGLNVVQIDGTVIEPMLPAFDKINSNFATVDAAIRNEFTTADDTVLADASADATAKADAAELAAKTYADGIVATEISSRDAADTDLQSNIDAEITRATGIESGLRTDVDSIQSQVTSNDSDILALQGLQSGDVTDLQSQLDAEVVRASGVEASLRTDVDTVTGRVDTIIGSSPESLDTIQEIVAAFEDADSDLQQVIDNNSGRLTSAESDIGAVEVRATDLESRATTTESDVASTQGEINTLQSEMDVVEGRATSLESRMTSAESDVGSIEVRTTDLETNVTQTQSKIGTGSFDTTAQDNIGAVNEVHGELDASVSRIDGHDSTVADLQTQITSEVGRATTQESTILSELAASSGVLDNQNSSGNPVKLWTGTQSQYSALTPDPDTLYFITG